MVSSQAVPTGLTQLSFAGLGRRIGAYFIDMLIFAAVFLAVGFTLKWLRILGFWTPPEGIVETPPEVQWRALGIPAQISVVLAFFVALGLFYLAFLEASPWQASIGKRLLDMHVTDAAGKRLSLSRSLGRSFAKCLFNGFYVGAISIFTIALDAQKQALHDKVAKTRVVRGRPAVSGAIEMCWALAALGITYLWLVVTFTAVFRTLR
jgi:uncharacterized RDD family membrane protein YckC